MTSRDGRAAYTYYECLDCGWDTIRNSVDITGPCPECAGDSGGEGRMAQRPATDDDGSVEGKDDRIAARQEGESDDQS
jgi:hypothetical protein